MYGKTLAAIAALTCVGTSVSAAQGAAYHPAASVLFVPATDVATPDSAHLVRTYWKEGALGLGVPVGVLSALVFHGLCEDSETPNPDCTGATVGGALFGFLIGAIPGALIGGQFKKGP